MENKDLKLSDYKKIWTKFCFLDKSGSLGNPKEPFFTIGFIKCSQPYKRLGIAGVCRFDSKCNDLLQVTDLIIGAINYDLKLGTGLIVNGDKYKKRFLKHLKEKIGVEGFVGGFKNYIFSIFVDKDVRRRLPIKTA